ncbi:thioredoxin-like protein [Pseudohyphozyma bogoriensis]|nr:thioredoxin-like protein [Pseudohyphozyma bogoriensis]
MASVPTVPTAFEHYWFKILPLIEAGDDDAPIILKKFTQCFDDDMPVEYQLAADYSGFNPFHLLIQRVLLFCGTKNVALEVYTKGRDYWRGSMSNLRGHRNPNMWWAAFEEQVLVKVLSKQKVQEDLVQIAQEDVDVFRKEMHVETLAVPSVWTYEDYKSALQILGISLNVYVEDSDGAEDTTRFEDDVADEFIARQHAGLSYYVADQVEVLCHWLQQNISTRAARASEKADKSTRNSTSSKPKSTAQERKQKKKDDAAAAAAAKAAEEEEARRQKEKEAAKKSGASKSTPAPETSSSKTRKKEREAQKEPGIEDPSTAQCF